MYQLYTLPNCEKCQEVRKVLDKKGVKYREVNAGVGDGKRDFREFYNENKSSIKRLEGQIGLPILFDGTKVIQGKDNIINHLQ